MKNNTNNRRFPITYERLSPSVVKIICSVNGSKKEIIARVATEGHYDTYLDPRAEPVKKKK